MSDMKEEYDFSNAKRGALIELTLDKAKEIIAKQQKHISEQQKAIDKLNKDKQILAEALDRCVLYAKQHAHLSLNDQEKYKELAKQHLKE